MANQHTRAREQQAAAAAAAEQGAPVITDDGPDVGPTAEELAVQAAELQAQLEATQAELEASRAALAARPRQGSTVVVNQAPQVGVAVVAPPTEPTYEPGEVDDDGVAYAATIIAHGPKGEQVECTPKVFRTILAAKGFTAHPLDAAQHLGNEPTRSRRRTRANVDGANPEQVTAARRRRRAAPAAE